ncbi:MAG TPA: hypothetical protein VF735_19475 [Pyrinomonadaceae bacterium]
MSEQRDDTTDGGTPSPAGSEPRPAGSYYYDDATGYEIYDPSDEDEEDAEEPADREEDVSR